LPTLRGPGIQRPFADKKLAFCDRRAGKGNTAEVAPKAMGYPSHSLGRRRRGRAVFRVTEARIVGLDDDGVTIRHKHRASGRWHTTRLNGHPFMRRFLQHMLPIDRVGFSAPTL
jgi:hypothetical protein